MLCLPKVVEVEIAVKSDFIFVVKDRHKIDTRSTTTQLNMTKGKSVFIVVLKEVNYNLLNRPDKCIKPELAKFD